MHDSLQDYGVHRVPRATTADGEQFVVVYYFEGRPETGLMKEYITIYRSYELDLAELKRKLVTKVNWSALGSLADAYQIERFVVALKDALRLKKAIDNGLATFDGEKLVGEW